MWSETWNPVASEIFSNCNWSFGLWRAVGSKENVVIQCDEATVSEGSRPVLNFFNLIIHKFMLIIKYLYLQNDPSGTDWSGLSACCIRFFSLTTADKSLTAKPQSLWRSLQVLRCVFQSGGLQNKKNKSDKLEKLRIKSCLHDHFKWFKFIQAMFFFNDFGWRWSGPQWWSSSFPTCP